MFGSISIAPPNSVVSTSFTATKPCVVELLEATSVRVNGQTTLSRVISLNTNDNISVSVMSDGPSAHKYVAWKRDGNLCYFAVASNEGPQTSSVLQKVNRNKPWYTYPAPSTFM